MTALDNAANVATAKGYRILVLTRAGDGYVAVASRLSPFSAPDHLAHACFRFNTDGTFHSCNYFRTSGAAYDAFFELAK